MTYIENFRSYSDKEWLELLKQSVVSPLVKSLQFPKFAQDDIQALFVGSSNEQALEEAYNFYSFMKKSAEELSNPIYKHSTVLDFGCGWGRFLRFFWKDVAENNIFGVDIDPSIIETCHRTLVPGQLSVIEAKGSLPHKNNSVDAILSYSVFTHLPENIHKHWMDEFKRVAKPGCVVALTIEPRRFLDFVGALAGKVPESGWHAGLKEYAEKVPEYLRDYDAGKIVFLPTGGGDYRDASVYGDAVCPIEFLKKSSGPEFAVLAHIDDPARFWQAAVILQYE